MIYDEEMIEPNFKIQPAEIMKKLSEGEQPSAEDLGNLSKVKAKIEIVGDYEDMEN
jgi:hypothetical protein